MNELLTPRDFLIIGFFGFWGLVGLGIIATVMYLWMKDCHSDDQPHIRARRRQRE